MCQVIPFSPQWIEAYYEAILGFVEEYREWIQDEPAMAELASFMDEFSKEVPLLKLDRWFGYVQGILIERGFTTVGAERDRTRSKFRALDFGNHQA